MTSYEVPDGPKMLRETLCLAAAEIGNAPRNEDRKRSHLDRLQRLIDECDRHRPLGPDGKHGDRHTATCGCEDVEADPAPTATYRVGNHQPQNVYRGDTYIGVMFTPEDAALVVEAMNAIERDHGPALPVTVGNYGPGQPRPRPLPDGHTITRDSAGTVTVNTDNACPDRYASPHGAGTRPGGCATCATQCPHCTSDRRDFRYVMPRRNAMNGAFIDTAPCDNPWHNTTTEQP